MHNIKSQLSVPISQSDKPALSSISRSQNVFPHKGNNTYTAQEMNQRPLSFQGEILFVGYIFACVTCHFQVNELGSIFAVLKSVIEECQIYSVCNLISGMFTFPSVDGNGRSVFTPIYIYLSSKLPSVTVSK